MQKHDILMCENNIYMYMYPWYAQLLYFYKDWFTYADELPATYLPVLPATPLRYENRSRQQQRALPLACL